MPESGAVDLSLPAASKRGAGSGMIGCRQANDAFPRDVCVWGTVVGRTPFFCLSKACAGVHGLFELRPTLAIARHSLGRLGVACRFSFPFTNLIMPGLLHCTLQPCWLTPYPASSS